MRPTPTHAVPLALFALLGGCSIHTSSTHLHSAREHVHTAPAPAANVGGRWDVVVLGSPGQARAADDDATSREATGASAGTRAVQPWSKAKRRLKPRPTGKPTAKPRIERRPTGKPTAKPRVDSKPAAKPGPSAKPDTRPRVGGKPRPAALREQSKPVVEQAPRKSDARRRDRPARAGKPGRVTAGPDHERQRWKLGRKPARSERSERVMRLKQKKKRGQRVEQLRRKRKPGAKERMQLAPGDARDDRGEPDARERMKLAAPQGDGTAADDDGREQDPGKKAAKKARRDAGKRKANQSRRRMKLGSGTRGPD